MVEDFIAGRDCPKDCPFLDRIAGGVSIRICTFSLYADLIEPGRHTRTEINQDGSVDYKLPPECDVYEKYKDRPGIIKEAKRKYETQAIQLRLHHKRDKDLYVTGGKHSPFSRYR